MKLKKGDQVKILRGKDKEKTGKIEKVFAKEGMALIPGVNEYKRHLKARSQRQPSEIITVTKPMKLSNLSIICPNCKLATRVKFIIDGEKKNRACVKCKKTI